MTDKKYVMLILLVFGIFLLVSGFRLYYIGYHNVDLVYNAKSLLCNFKGTIDNAYDTYNSKGDTIPLTELYNVGREQQTNSILLILLGGLLVGFSIREMIL